MGILRLAHVDVKVPDLDLATAYYTEVMGMSVTEADGDSVDLKCWDEIDHHSLRLCYHRRTGLDLFSFKVEAEDDLADLEGKVEAYGARVRRVSRGEERGQGESIRFETPSGHEMELVYDIERVGRLPGTVNPAPVPYGLRGIAPPRLDHVLVTAEEVGEATRFYTEILDFRPTEQLLDGNGHQLGVWMERSHTPHDLAVVVGENGGLHHFAYWVDDWDHVRRAADVLVHHGLPIDVGPTRHGITRGNTVYFHDPVGIRNEVFTGGYRPDPDFRCITWTEDQLGRGLFYWEGTVAERFLRVHS